MDKAKQAVSGFLHKDGKHDTTVHETVNPAIQNERISRGQHEEVTTAVDREVHQDHHHTTVQPIHHKEVAPEQHSHNLAAVQHKEIHHGDDSHVKERLAAEAAQFKNTREVGDVQHSSSVGGTVAGEHVHHHVHEHIQPVIQKETVQNQVVHTTVPVHEVHHNESKHHTASALPAISMADFKKQGGSLGGREERTDAFQGEPRSVGKSLGGTGAAGSTSLTEKEGHSQGSYGTSATGGSGAVGGSHSTPRNEMGKTGTTHNSSSTHGTSHDAVGKKPSLLDRINPMKDTDGDGKKGMMD